MEPLIRTVSAWDRLPICVRVWPGRTDTPPLLCLPGIVRTGADFAGLAAALDGSHRVIALDYPGRGASGRARDISRYAPEACARDILDVCAALHLHRLVAVGTSFGGFMAMGLAVLRPTLLRGVVLNDVGPEIGADGDVLVREFVGHDPALPSLDACVAHLKATLPPLSLDSDAAGRRAAELTYAPGADGRYHPIWDTRIVRLLDAPRPQLWPLFDALAHLKLLLVRGALSDILLAETVTRMRERRPDMVFAEVADVGHAPILTEPVALTAIRGFLETLP